jgi:hypothetical protein
MKFAVLVIRFRSRMKSPILVMKSPILVMKSLKRRLMHAA